MFDERIFLPPWAYGSGLFKNKAMCYNFVVEFQVRKGLGPDFVQKMIAVIYDDVDEDIPEYVVKDWAIKEAEAYLKHAECPVFIYVEIHYA